MRYGRWKNLQGVIETSMDWGPLCVEFMPACSKGCREWSQLLDVTLASDITLFQKMPVLVGIQSAYIHFKTIFGHESKYLPGYSPNEKKTKQGLSGLSPHPGCGFKATSTPPLLNLIHLGTRLEWINCVGTFFPPCVANIQEKQWCIWKPNVIRLIPRINKDFDITLSGLMSCMF